MFGGVGGVGCEVVPQTALHCREITNGPLSIFLVILLYWMRACNLPVYTGRQPRMAEASPSPSGEAAMHLLKDSAHQEWGPATVTPQTLFQLFKH